MTTLPPSSKMKRRRILISGGLAVGGAQTHIMILCAVLREAGADVTIASASTNWSHDAIANLRAMGVRVVVSPFGFGPFQILGKIWSLLAWPFVLRRDYDVLYCIGEGKMHLVASRFVAKGGFRMYHEIVECPAPRSVAAQVAATMDAAVANSARVGRAMSELLPALPVQTIPFLTSTAPVDPPVPRPYNPKGILRIAFLGRLISHKRPAQLIEALVGWNASAPMAPARLDLYGGDYNHEGDRLQSRIGKLGLQESVRMHGAYTTDDLPRIFAATDIVVLPSLYEGLPLVLVEAMQRGVPVVATSAGGTAELGEDNPDVIITPGTEWSDFEAGLLIMAQRVREGKIDAARLHAWTESRYGFVPVAQAWREALLTPEMFFAQERLTEVPA